MRKVLAVLLVGGLVLATLPTDVLAGDPHAVRNRWTGVGIGIAVATLGGLLVGAMSAPVVAAPPPVAVAPPPLAYTPPPVVYTPPPVVYAPPPVVVYSRPPVVVYRGWAPPGHWRHHR